LAPPFEREPIGFNVSHCAHLALCAVAQNREIGVDVAEIRPVPEATQVATRFITRYRGEARS
jgi:4'-phosphopantetheinyl transferase